MVEKTMIVFQKPGQTHAYVEGQYVGLPEANANIYFQVWLGKQEGEWGYVNRQSCLQRDYDAWERTQEEVV